MSSATICLVTPALKRANNGNWQTAARWSRWLAEDYRVRLVEHWQGEQADLMIALHARRSADSIQAWAGASQGPLAVVLTGTDLYRDIAIDAAARRSLDLAQRLVVLNEAAPASVPEAVRGKCLVCLQSATPRRTLPKPARHLRALMVGHLREEKDPLTYLAAVRRLAGRDDLLFDHIGGALDEALGAQALALQQAVPGYRWLGARSHGETRDRIQRAHVLVHPSRMEGGAHVVIEAVACGTPVLASRIEGNMGLLGAGYTGYFEPGDDAGLATLVARCRDDPAMLPALQAQCAQRAPLFDPARERATVMSLVADLLETRP